ncbi:MAG TPA: DNA primase [Mariprofundaceae bacterium]|nr:DNA primase [Mariprofundaceae bacterium]
MAQFSSTFLDELISRSDLAELISRHVDLKPSGANLVGLCPFHHEKSPSFSVSVDKQMYYCFGCGKGGNAFRFLMEHDGYPFPEAVEFLAQKAGMPIPDSKPVNPEEAARKKSGLELLDKVAGIFSRTLNSDEGKKAREYFEMRKLSPALIQKYQLGYAPAGYGFMKRCFGEDNHNLSNLESIGVLIKNERGYADRFRERVMFPIRDKQSRVVGFGGRILGDGEPKYLNSPETDFYHKSHLLYGYAEHRESVRKHKMLVVVEGYMDVLAMASYDLDYAVAPLGTAITESQLNMILRLLETPVFCFDGDKAGRKAAWRSIERMLPILKSEHSPRFLYLPDGEDPDTLLQKEGKDAFEKRLKEDGKPMLETWVLGLKNIAGDGAEGRARMAKKADVMLSTMTDDYLRQAWQGEIEKATEVKLSLQKPAQTLSRSKQPIARKPAQYLAVNPMKHDQFMAGLLQNPVRFQNLPDDAFDFFIDTHPIYPIYTRAFSLVGDEKNTELDIAAQLMREFPDNQHIARWVNLPIVDDVEFQQLLMDMHITYLNGLHGRSKDIGVKMRIIKELKTLQVQQKQFNKNLSHKESL